MQLIASICVHRRLRPSLVVLVCLVAVVGLGGVAPEFQVKRQEVFEFTQGPSVQRDGDRVAITFVSQAFCDATVGVEDGRGRIVRHLASGVLGPHAPEPFQRDSLKQTVVWDGKNEKGEYVDDKESLTVRVSLGLKPQFERALFWEPRKRTTPAPPFYWSVVGPTGFLIWPSPPLARVTEEGVFVYDSHSFDHLSLFDHEGNYVRTVYPFPASKIEDVKGVTWHTAPQDGRRLPLKQGAHQCTLLTSGDNLRAHSDGYFGVAATVMAVRAKRIALAMLSLNRLATDGSSGGLALEGPRTSLQVDHGSRWRGIVVPPRSAALSPDGRWLYLTRYGYAIQGGFYATFYYLPGVFRLAMEGDAEPEVFVGGRTLADAGTGTGRFNVPSSVACDSAGRVYVSDHWNDCIQAFSPEGEHLKTIPVRKPAKVRVDQRTGEIYVFSWMFHSNFLADANEKGKVTIQPTLTRLGPLENPVARGSCPLPLEGYSATYNAHSARGGWEFDAELDSWADPPAIWLVPGMPSTSVPWARAGLRRYVLKDGRLERTRDFGQETQQSLGRARPPDRLRQHLYVNPKTGMLDLAELDTAMYHCWRNLIRFDPNTGAESFVQLPFYVQDMAYDTDGLAYLRWYNLIARFDPVTWREAPWDYGVARTGVGLVAAGQVASALAAPGACSFNYFGGMSVSPTGRFAFSTSGNAAAGGRLGNLSTRWREEQALAGVRDKLVLAGGEPYKPALYPGRYVGQEVHVWDERGRLVCEDAIPGMLEADGGVAIDRHDNVYIMAAANRVLDGKPYFRSSAGSLMKFRPRTGRFVTSSPEVPVPLPAADRPTRPPDFRGANGLEAWADRPKWIYGGVGYLYQNTGQRCYCWKSRFALDDFGRSFAPEIDHYTVAVLDTNGNVITRIGQYGNADDGVPLESGTVPSSAGASQSPVRRSIGGDEVALFHPAYLATHTDRRLFIADIGNYRILSVKLGYHAEERVPLKDVEDERK